MNLKTLECVFADCQSTGASPANGNILEIAWCKASTLVEPETIHSFVLQQPENKPIPFIIQNITGIGERELEDAISPVEAYSSFTSAFGGDDRDQGTVGFAVIHYGRFERAFLQDWHQSFNTVQKPLPFKIVCTYEIAKRIFPNFPTRGINGLAGFFGATINDTKRSACHVQATWLIWRGLVEELNKLGIETTSQLEEWLATVKAAKRTKIEYPLEKTKRSKLPDKPGVYRMFDRAGNILYVGKATSLKSRVNSYFRGRSGKDARRMEMLTRVHDLQVTECDTPLEAAILETDEIKRLNPPFNVVLKTGRRQLIYYNRSLGEWSKSHDETYHVGPFSGPFHMEPLIRLSTSLEQGKFDAQIFFDFVEPDLLKSGFEIFAANSSFPVDYRTPRQLMTFALRQYKRLIKARQVDVIRKLQEAMSSEANLESMDPSTAASGAKIDFLDLNVEENKLEDGVELELTPEDVAGKFDRMLLRAAKAYLQAKAVRAIANASVEFSDGGIAKQLHVCEGAINASSEPFSNVGLQTMDLTTFDRLRVLLSELGRISAAGSPVRIQYVGAQSVPRWLLSRSGI